jgi:uncharacterized membrane protein YagU involved in acid resistance
MNWGSWLVWGFAATIVLTTVMEASRGLRLTRMSIPYMVGMMFTPDRDRAMAIGIGIHLINGWLFSLVYVLAFQQWGEAGWWRGGAIGLFHGLFVLTVGMRILPGLHLRMASERQGPTVMRQLEPPGFLALNYGAGTPTISLLAHVIFGIILGAFYRVSV